jgi:hypothetical protein
MQKRTPHPQSVAIPSGSSEVSGMRESLSFMRTLFGQFQAPVKKKFGKTV